MKSFTRVVVCSHLLLATITPTQAQPVYRCGNSYSQIPCDGAVTVQADDARSDQQRNDARQALTKDKALAIALETRRKQEEAIALATEKTLPRRAPLQEKQAEKVSVVPKTWIRTDLPRNIKQSRANKGSRTPEKSNKQKKRPKDLVDEP